MTKKEAQNNTFLIPLEVSYVTKTLEKGGFEAYLVGGCVRDLLLHKKPKDWDVTTNATPEQIQALFPETFYENTFGTVGVKSKGMNASSATASAPANTTGSTKGSANVETVGNSAGDPTLEVI